MGEALWNFRQLPPHRLAWVAVESWLPDTFPYRAHTLNDEEPAVLAHLLSLALLGLFFLQRRLALLFSILGTR